MRVLECLSENVCALGWGPDGVAWSDEAVTTLPGGRRTDPADALAWIDGWIIADRERLWRPGGPEVAARGQVAFGGDAVWVLGETLQRRCPRTLEVLETLPLSGQQLAVAGGAVAGDRIAGDTVAVVDGARLRWRRGGAAGELALPLEAHTVALSPGGDRVVVGHWSGGAWEGPLGGPLTQRGWGRAGDVCHGGGWFWAGGRLFWELDHPGDVLRFGGGTPDRVVVGPGGEPAALFRQFLIGLSGPQEPPLGPLRRTTALWAGGGRVVAATDDGRIFTWRDGVLEGVVDARVGGVEALAMRGDQLLIGALEGVEIWEGGRAVDAWSAPGLAHIKRLVMAPDGGALALGHETAVRFSAEGEPLARFGPWLREDDYKANTTDAALNPADGAAAVALHYGQQPAAAYGRDGEALEALPGASSLCFSAAGDALLLSGGREGLRLSWPERERRPCPSFLKAAALEEGWLWAAGRLMGRLDRGGEEVWTGQYHDDIHALAADPERGRCWTGGHAVWIGERRLEDGALVRALPAGGGGKISALAFSPDGRTLAAGEYGGRLHLWSLEALARVGLLDGSTLQPPDSPFEVGRLGELEALAWPGALTAACNRLLRWASPGDLSDPEDRTLEDTNPSQLTPDGRFGLCGGGWGAEVRVIDLETGEERIRLEGPDGRDRVVRLSHDGRTLVLGTADGETRLEAWDVATGEPIASLQADAAAFAARFDARGRLLLGLRRDEGGATWAAWRPRERALERWLAPHPALDGASDFAAAGERALVWGTLASLVDAGSGEVRTLAPLESAVTCGALSADGELAAIGGWYGESNVYRRGTLLGRLCHTHDGGWWSQRPGEPRRYTPGSWA